MPSKNKPLQPLDRAVAELLVDAVEHAGTSRRELVARSGVGLNRLNSILNLKTPPVTVGEVDMVARALGTTASAIFRAAERKVDLMATDEDGEVAALYELKQPGGAMSEADTSMDPIAAQTRDVQKEFDESND